MAKVLVTGGLGFVGRAVVEGFNAAGDEVVVSTRQSNATLPSAKTVQVQPLGPDTDWTSALQGVEMVVHLAARVHVMRETADDPMSEFRTANVLGTESLARAAVAAGVRRFVFLSSVKVNGERTAGTARMAASDPPHPQDPYGISKKEAEDALRKVSESGALETVILRTPLVYGPGVGGNFAALMRLVHSGVPLPLGAVNNRRSLIYVANLADAIVTSAHHERASGETFMVSDGQPVSTSELIKGIAAALGVRARLVPVPSGLLRMAGLITGRTAQVSRLLDSLVVDDHKIAHNLDWEPPYSMLTGLGVTGRRYLESKSLDSR